MTTIMAMVREINTMRLLVSILNRPVLIIYKSVKNLGLTTCVGVTVLLLGLTE